ncbi:MULTISPECIES: cell division protein SepF [unclassified Micromonospora]|uniref:cell division protein SepF n=1 Tax=unclassified Micromonospora TaxID=2617518 RepID=UPI001C219EAC|nr:MULTISPECIES: cell division protein SepF [unclassified Micromonospora]MBU8856163.1 cell division protein SepF [Micromonospora sp. WMMB482]MDM4781768.1 cell division protein SepF [Micromonospora sp. b486]
MGALRKAGVWLGLVEEDDERAYEDGGYDKGGYRDSSRYRSSRYAEEFADEDDDETEEPPTTRSRIGDRGRLSERASSRAVDADRAESERPERAERSSVRSITRSSAGDTSGALTYHTRDNLALAPQAQPRERERMAPEDEQRYQITTLHPTTYREARTIGEHFRDGVPVIINLTEMDEADARRLVDFAAGLAFGLRGTIERVTNRVFLLSPANVQVTAEDKAKIAEGGFFSLS